MVFSMILSIARRVALVLHGGQCSIWFSASSQAEAQRILPLAVSGSLLGGRSHLILFPQLHQHHRPNYLSARNQ